MGRPRVTTRRLMILIAILSPLFLVVSWPVELGRSLGDFYGPSGSLALESCISRDFEKASEALRVGRFEEAEAQYRAMLKTSDRLAALKASHGWGDQLGWSDEIHLGLAESLAGRGRLAEALSESWKVLEGRERMLGADHPALAGTLERRADLLRRLGRVEEARISYGLAATILGRLEGKSREVGRGDEAGRVKIRAEALRS